VDAARPVIVPGEIELKKMAQQRANGIVLDEATVSLLLQHASA
jgi:LDH2 family malate/lactate/ureidoglycolate dehydrogenase